MYYCTTVSLTSRAIPNTVFSMILPFNHDSADPPKITLHPKDQSVATGADVTFEVKATGDDLHFQWLKDQSDLDDSDRCCGTHTNKLRLVEVEKADKGHYRCLVKSLVGKELSDEAFLTVSKWFMFVWYRLARKLSEITQ